MTFLCKTKVDGDLVDLPAQGSEVMRSYLFSRLDICQRVEIREQAFKHETLGYLRKVFIPHKVKDRFLVRSMDQKHKVSMGRIMLNQHRMEANIRSWSRTKVPRMQRYCSKRVGLLCGTSRT